MAIDQIPYSPKDEFSILDLGAGTGLFAALVKEAFPKCLLTLTDVSAEMLEKAKQRFDGHTDIDFLIHDYINEQLPQKYDVIISGLSLHHSTKEELDSVFNKLHAGLRNGGVFINADQILGRTRDIEICYEERWLEKAIEKGCTEEEIEIALKRMEADKTLPLSVQMELLESNEFQIVNCWYQYYRYAVYSGIKRTSN